MISSIEAMKDSPPSSEKRFWPTYLVCRKRSRPRLPSGSAEWISSSWGPQSGLVRVDSSPLHDPASGHRVRDVHELGADLAAVGLAQGGDHVAQAHLLRTKIQVVGPESGVQVGLRKIVESRLEVGDRRTLAQTQGI